MQRKKKQQAQIIAEYALVIFLIVAAVIAMMVFTKRLLQARIRDAHVYMLNEVRQADTSVTIPDSYEPYYTVSTSDIARESNDRLVVSEQPTIHIRKEYDQTVISNTVSESLPPKEANAP